MKLFCFAFFCYLYGAIPYAYLATRIIRKKDLRTEGTGNIGVTNAFKVGGKSAGLLTIAGEISKAVIPILTARFFFNDRLNITLLFVFLSFLGTSFSIFLKGKGGKGSTVTLWSLGILSPYGCLVLLFFWSAIVLYSKNNPKLKIIPLFLIPVIFHIFERNVYFTTFCTLISITTYINNRIRLDDYKFYNIFNKPPEN